MKETERGEEWSFSGQSRRTAMSYNLCAGDKSRLREPLWIIGQSGPKMIRFSGEVAGRRDIVKSHRIEIYGARIKECKERIW